MPQHNLSTRPLAANKSELIADKASFHYNENWLSQGRCSKQDTCNMILPKKKAKNNSYFAKFPTSYADSKELAISNVNFLGAEVSFDLIDLHSKTIFCDVKLSDLFSDKELFEKLNDHSQQVFWEIWKNQRKP